MKTYKMNGLRELYRVDNKYWKTGDLDLLPLRMLLAKGIDERFWDNIASITAMITRSHMPFNKLVEVLSVLGYEQEEKGERNEAD